MIICADIVLMKLVVEDVKEDVIVMKEQMSRRKTEEGILTQVKAVIQDDKARYLRDKSNYGER